jgi:hypothetical protein
MAIPMGSVYRSWGWEENASGRLAGVQGAGRVQAGASIPGARHLGSPQRMSLAGGRDAKGIKNGLKVGGPCRI